MYFFRNTSVYGYNQPIIYSQIKPSYADPTTYEYVPYTSQDVYTPSPAQQYLPSNYQTSYYHPEPLAMISEPEKHDNAPIGENDNKEEVVPENKIENKEKNDLNDLKVDELKIEDLPKPEEDMRVKKAAKIIRPTIIYYCGELENDEDTILNPDWREQNLFGIGNGLLDTKAPISLKGKQKIAGEPIKEPNQLFDDKDDQKDFDFTNPSKKDEQPISEALKQPMSGQKPESNEISSHNNNLNSKRNERSQQLLSPEVIEEDSPEVIEDDDEDY